MKQTYLLVFKIFAIMLGCIVGWYVGQISAKVFIWLLCKLGLIDGFTKLMDFITL